MSELNNYDIMRHFPSPEGLADSYERQEALLASYMIVSAARAAIDEVASRSKDLPIDDQFTLSSIAEILSSNANHLFDVIDK